MQHKCRYEDWHSAVSPGPPKLYQIRVVLGLQVFRDSLNLSLVRFTGRSSCDLQSAILQPWDLSCLTVTLPLGILLVFPVRHPHTASVSDRRHVSGLVSRPSKDDARNVSSLPGRILLVCVWVLCLEGQNGGLAVLNSVLVLLLVQLQGLNSVCLIYKDVKAWSGFHAQITGWF